MMKVFVDTNVLIDVLEKQEPFYLFSANIFELSICSKIDLYATSLSFINAIYVCRKTIGTANAVDKVKGLRKYVHISPMSEKEFDAAISLESRDLEDSLQYCSAVSSGCDVMVTRNKKDFPVGGVVEILTPQEFFAQYGSPF